jgi:hypothetical protein
MLEPLGQSLGDRVTAEVQHSTVLEFPSGVETLQTDVQRIGAMLEQQPFAGRDLGIGTDASPECLRASLGLDKRHYLMVVCLGVDLIAHLDQQSYVLIRAKACIQPELCFNWS